MEIKDYQEAAVRTMASCNSPLMDELHMTLGMITESSELADMYKKHIAYGKPKDMINAKEEIGDIMWYIANYCTMNGWDLRDILETNISKLRVRYPEKFDNNLAINRDLISERKTLEK